MMQTGIYRNADDFMAFLACGNLIYFFSWTSYVPMSSKLCVTVLSLASTNSSRRFQRSFIHQSVYVQRLALPFLHVKGVIHLPEIHTFLTSSNLKLYVFRFLTHFRFFLAHLSFLERPASQLPPETFLRSICGLAVTLGANQSTAAEKQVDVMSGEPPLNSKDTEYLSEEPSISVLRISTAQTHVVVLFVRGPFLSLLYLLQSILPKGSSNC